MLKESANVKSSGTVNLDMFEKYFKNLSILTWVGGVCKTEIYCFRESVNQMMMCIYC